MSEICLDGGVEECKSLEISWQSISYSVGCTSKHLLLGNINLCICNYVMTQSMSVLTFTGTGFLAQSLHVTH